MFKKAFARFFFILSVCFLFSIISQLGFLSSSMAVTTGGVLKVAVGGQANRMDPPNSAGDVDITIMDNIFETLVYYHYDEMSKAAEPKPLLAEKWEKSPDGMVWTFHLKKGVKFHDGTPFDAAAVKYNFDRITGGATYGRDLKEAVDHTEVVDDHTFKVYLKSSAPIFLNILGTPYVQMVSPTAAEKYGDKIGSHPVGTGPFVFSKWVSGDYAEVKANDEYWGGRPHLDGILFRFVEDNNARISMLQTGEIDLAYNIPVPDHERLQKSDKIDVKSWPTALITRIFIHCSVPPFDDTRVRRAMKYAIDTEAIVSDILKGNGKAPASPAVENSWGYYPADPPTYDPEKAKELLKEAGWVDKDGDGIREKEGKNLVFTVNCTPPGRGQMRQEIVLAIQQYLRQVGFDCKVVFENFGSLIARGLCPIDKAKEGGFILNWSSKSDAWFILSTWYHSGRWYPDKKHLTHYRNVEFDKLLDQAAVEVDNQKRFEFYKQAQIILAHDTPIINLSVDYNTLAKRKYVKGVKYVPIPVQDSFLYIREVWLDK